MGHGVAQRPRWEPPPVAFYVSPRIPFRGIWALPRGPAWLHERRFNAAWTALREVAEGPAWTPGELAELTRRRVQERIDLEERGGFGDGSARAAAASAP